MEQYRRHLSAAKTAEDMRQAEASAAVASRAQAAFQAQKAIKDLPDLIPNAPAREVTQDMALTQADTYPSKRCETQA